jgi:hypothetical protein
MEAASSSEMSVKTVPCHDKKKWRERERETTLTKETEKA